MDLHPNHGGSGLPLTAGKSHPHWQALGNLQHGIRGAPAKPLALATSTWHAARARRHAPLPTKPDPGAHTGDRHFIRTVISEVKVSPTCTGSLCPRPVIGRVGAPPRQPLIGGNRHSFRHCQRIASPRWWDHTDTLLHRFADHDIVIGDERLVVGRIDDRVRSPQGGWSGAGFRCLPCRIGQNSHRIALDVRAQLSRTAGVKQDAIETTSQAGLCQVQSSFEKLIFSQDSVDWVLPDCSV